jgi:hypothetical protein
MARKHHATGRKWPTPSLSSEEAGLLVAPQRHAGVGRLVASLTVRGTQNGPEKSLSAKSCHHGSCRDISRGQSGPGRSPSPGLLEDLRCAWDELAEAAKNSRVTNFHASTRTGRPWTEDPAAVRAIAATLREFPDKDSRPGA